MLCMSGSDMEFCHLNVRSLRAGFHVFSDLIREYDFDIVSLSETWLSSDVKDVGLSVQDYNIVRKDRDGRGGGVAFYLKNNYRYTVIDIGNSNSPLEQLWLCIKHAGKRLCVGTLYRPPNCSVLQALDTLEDSLTRLLPEYDYVIFGTDFNVDLSDGTNNYSLALQNLFDKYGLFQAVAGPTRLGNRSSTLLDLLVSSDASLVSPATVVDVKEISDHMLVSFKIKLGKLKPETFFKTYRDYKNLNYNHFLHDLNLINWEYIYSLNSTDEMVTFFNSELLKLFDKHAPYKTSKISKPPAPWLTENLRFLMRLRDKARTRYRRTGSAAASAEYRALRNRVNITVRSEKKAYLQHTFQRDPKNFWRTIRYLNLCSKSSSNTLIEASADSFNDYYLNSVPQIVQNDNSFIETNYLNKVHNNVQLNLFSFSPVSALAIEKIILGLKSNAMGHDGINLKMFYYIIPHLTDFIAFIVNRCLATGNFPDNWKLAYVVPLAKISNPTLTKDFRPISILPFFSKILERVVRDQLTNYCNSVEIIPPTQSGFRKNHGTATALLHVTDDIIRAYDKNKCTSLILLDYSKAFDTINHETLLLKLKFYGLDEVALNFFRTYLSNRRQRVSYNSSLSQVALVNRGVPQGSVLGPLLFSLYTADLSEHLNCLECHQFADDTQVYYSFLPGDLENAVSRINQDLQVLGKVSEAHSLILNEAKTQLMVFGKHRRSVLSDSNFRISINGSFLAPVECCKSLGLLVDTDLRFSNHVNNLIQKTYGKLKLLYMHKDLFDTDTKLRLSESLVLSHLNYCDVVFWPCLLVRDRESLQRLQNACLRFSYGVRKYDHISSYLRRSGWLTIQERYELHLACLVYRVDSQKRPTYLYNKLEKLSDFHQICTRHGGRYCVPKHNSQFFKRSFSYTAANIFNNLPTNIKNSLSIISFHKKTKNHIIASRVPAR